MPKESVKRNHVVQIFKETDFRIREKENRKERDRGTAGKTACRKTGAGRTAMQMLIQKLQNLAFLLIVTELQHSMQS